MIVKVCFILMANEFKEYFQVKVLFRLVLDLMEIEH